MGQSEHAAGNEVAETAIETGSAVAAALVGLIFGGPVGAVAGAVTSPVLSKTVVLLNRARQRRSQRAARIVDNSIDASGLSPDQAVEQLATDDRKADDFLGLLVQAAEADPGLESAFISLLAQVLMSDSPDERERVLIVGDTLRGLRSVHLRILRSLNSDGPVLRAAQLADRVGVPEKELRSVVRDLEARGMIKDRGVHPIEWELRDLGKGVVRFASKGE